tara:strand:+ start:187 stop:600 length:414 start_codon:yes stop_codon:yes gene_type:complete
MNNVQISGTIDRDPIIRSGDNNGRPWEMARFTVITTETITPAKGDPFQKRDYITCKAWGSKARAILLADPGAWVEVSGRMTSEKYTNKDNQEVRGWFVDVVKVNTPLTQLADANEYPARAASTPATPAPFNDEDLPF